MGVGESLVLSKKGKEVIYYEGPAAKFRKTRSSAGWQLSRRKQFRVMKKIGRKRQ